jgi:L-fuculose-phosphate aldolase
MSEAALVQAYRDLSAAGLIVASAGNVSLRAGEGMLISPTGAMPQTLTEDRVVRMTLQGDWTGPWRPSSEWHMHAAIYEAFPDAGAIVHTHADAATALSCLNEPLPAFHYMLAEFGGDDLRCAPYVTFGTPELAALAIAALRGRTACLLANHGMICHGRDLAAAVTCALRLESLCRQYLLARQAGAPRLLTAQEMAAAHARYRTYGQQPEQDP